MSELLYKQAEVTSSGAGGLLTAWLSRYNNEDDQFDIMGEFCFADWKAANGGKPVPILKGHNTSEFPLGHWENFVETAEGLKATGRLALAENPEARIAADMIKAGLVTGVSVGFKMLDGHPARRKGGRMGRNITKAWLMEASICPFRPSNPLATVQDIDGNSVSSIYKAGSPEAILRDAAALIEAEVAAQQIVRLTARELGLKI